MYTQAILKQPSKSLVHGITSANLGKPDYNLALKQHDQYRNALEDCGLSTVILPAEEPFPDSVFIEDAAIVTGHMALITRPGAESRRGETRAVNRLLESMYPAVEHIDSPGMLDGGDVMQCHDRLYVGLSERTNREGIRQFAAIASRYGYVTITVPLTDMLHLKTGIAYLQHNNLLVVETLVDRREWDGDNKIVVSNEEAYAANSLWINGRVLIPAGFPATRNKLIEAGYDVTEVPVSEFRKLDGGLSCLSLRI